MLSHPSISAHCHRCSAGSCSSALPSTPGSAIDSGCQAAFHVEERNPLISSVVFRSQHFPPVKSRQYPAYLSGFSQAWSGLNCSSYQHLAPGAGSGVYWCHRWPPQAGCAAQPCPPFAGCTHPLPSISKYRF